MDNNKPEEKVMDNNKMDINNKMILRVCTALVVIGVLIAVAITFSTMRSYQLDPSGDHSFELRLFFAIGVLTGLALLFAFSITVYVWGPSNNGDSPGKAVFDACVKTIPPIITLVLGYYFGASSASQTKGAQKSQAGIESPGGSNIGKPPSKVSTE